MINRLIGRWLPIQVGPIVTKDFKLILRDLNNLSQVIGALIMGVVFGVMLLRAGGKPSIEQGNGPAQLTGTPAFSHGVWEYGDWNVRRLVYGCPFGIGCFFDGKGGAIGILKTVPVNADKLLTAKFLMAFIPSLILGCFYLIVITILQKPPLSTILYGLPSIGLILAGLCGINLAFGVRGVNLTWTDPRKMENGVAGSIGTIVSIIYQLVTLALFFGPPLVFPLLGISEKIGMLAGLLAGGGVSLLCTFLPLKMIKNRVETIGEE